MLEWTQLSRGNVTIIKCERSHLLPDSTRVYSWLISVLLQRELILRSLPIYRVVKVHRCHVTMQVMFVYHVRNLTQTNTHITKHIYIQLSSIKYERTNATRITTHVTLAITTRATVPESLSSDIRIVPSGCVLLPVIPVPVTIHQHKNILFLYIYSGFYQYIVT